MQYLLIFFLYLLKIFNFMPNIKNSKYLRETVLSRKIVRLIMAITGLSAQDLADRSGFTLSKIQRSWRGDTFLSIDELALIISSLRPTYDIHTILLAIMPMIEEYKRAEQPPKFELETQEKNL